MRPKIAMWSDYGAPTQKHWRSPSRRSARSSIGPKILLVAVVVVAGVIGISGIYPQIIDSEWVQNAGTHAKKVATPDATTTTRRSGIVAAIPLPPRRVATTTGEAAASAPRPAVPAPASAPQLSEMRSSVAAVELPPGETAPALADIPDAQAKADPPAEATPAAAAKPAERAVARLRAPVRKRVVRVEHHRGSSGAYAQYGGWNGGWGGWGGNFAGFR